MNTPKSTISPFLSPRPILKSSRSVKIKRAKSDPELAKLPSENSVKQKQSIVHKLRVARRYGHLDADLKPVPGSLEHDLLLEQQNRLNEFFGNNEKLPSPIYDKNGAIIPWRIVGSPQDFVKAQQNKSKEKLIPDVKVLTRRLSRLDIAEININRVFEKKEDPGVVLAKRLQEIQARKKKAQSERDLRCSTIEGKILQERQTRALETYSKFHNCWSSIETCLSNRLRSPPENLALNRGDIYREKIEEYNFIDRAATADERAGNHAWYMSLRSESSSNGSFFPIGNARSGLFTKMTIHSSEPETLIRRPGTVPSSISNFKRNPYFQDKLNSRSGKRVKLSSLAKFDELVVSGKDKLDLEIKAVNSLGPSKLSLEDLNEYAAEEELISGNYESRYYGMIG
jgi:hypothetical protein